MEQREEHLLNLAPMRVRRDSMESTVADYLAHEALYSSQAGFLQSETDCATFFTSPDASLELSDTEIIDELEFDEPLERFMRNEIAYNEFMEMTGGIGLDEEEADYFDVEDREYGKRLKTDFTLPDASLDIEGDNEELYDADYSLDDTFDDIGDIQVKPSVISTGILIFQESSASKLTSHERTLEEIDEDRLLGIPLELRNNEPVSGSSVKVTGSGGERRTRKNKTLEALIGQANVIYAKGQTKEALTMLQEVIRQEPRNPEPYRQVAGIYNDLNQPDKSFQYGLLAAHLSGTRASAVEWEELGNYALKLHKIEEAAACYGRAIRADQTNHFLYEKRIDALEKVGLNALAMRTRFMAAQSVNREQVDFEWFRNMITIAADHYIKLDDEQKAIAALETFVLRSREYNRDATEQLEIVIDLLMNSQRFGDAAKSIFALCPGIAAVDNRGRFAIEIIYNNASYIVKSFPPDEEHHFLIDERLSSVLLARLVICFIRIGCKNLVPTLVDKLFERPVNLDNQQLYLDIARSYHAVDCVAHAQKYIEHLLSRSEFSDVSEAWFLYGLYLSIRKKYIEACKAYHHALDLQPSHVDARINYSSIQQRLGMVEEAFETLRDYVLDAGNSIPDERLLIRQADFLFERKRMEEFSRCVRMMLAPHFYEIYSNNMALLKKRLSANEKGAKIGVHHGIRIQAFNAVRGSALEKYVKRVGEFAAMEERTPSEISSTQMHDYCLKLVETFLNQERFLDALHVCCYAYLQPLISKNTRTLETFQNLLLFCSISAHSWHLAFEYIRWYHTLSMNNQSVMSASDRDLLFTRIFNAMNFVFCRSQSVTYHRFIMRALTRTPNNFALQIISGNNSLITGAYRHALGEYLRAWKQNPDDPLVCMLIGLTFIHISCKKDIFSRHMVALRGVAFMNRYQRLRGNNQETNYNIGRMFHQMNILPLAMHFYEECLKADIPKLVITDGESGKQRLVEDESNICCLGASQGMDNKQDHEWELNRENIRPLRSGRRVQSINSVFSGPKISISEAEKRFEKDFELAKHSDNPLDICINFVKWFEENFPTGKQSHLFSVLTRIINAFGYREEYLNDERMLRFWIKLTENKSDANVDTFFERAYLAGCCRRLAKFYVRWAEVREDSQNINGARAVLNHGRENFAEPVNLLNEASDALEMRQLRMMMNLSDADDNEVDEVELNMNRLALGQLAGSLGPNREAPVVRDAFRKPGSLYNPSQSQSTLHEFAKEKKGNNFQIYQGDEVFDDGNLLVPRSFGDDLAHVALVQNSWDPTKWKDAKIDGIPKKIERCEIPFSVYDDNTIDLPEHKLMKKHSRLLVANKEMFVLALMEDTVRIAPHQFNEPFESVLTRRLNEQLANKIVPGLGLCIVIYDIVEIGASYILPGDGSSHTKVKFRFIVFRPFIDEVIEGKVLSSNREGLTISLIFFEDIFIPAHRLPHPSVFEEEEQVWYWEYHCEDGQIAKLYMDPGKIVLFRIVENVFKDIDPESSQDESKREKSYQIIGSMAETGLGCKLWWVSNEDSDD
ncbi:unnamed protein product [Thelazia callipaeda]|uniref:BUB1 N-terminal domain-containing protein n=1 Tax=Thelazia callipaeda TaxID=103827 RepID=A0A0N5CWI3_THECL|nr:unnamed protein product [Thelazia callipaeda]